MIADRKCRRRFARGQRRQDTKNQKPATMVDNIVTAIAALATIGGRIDHLTKMLYLPNATDITSNA
jgi:thiamine pyrophosphokinase